MREWDEGCGDDDEEGEVRVIDRAVYDVKRIGGIKHVHEQKTEKVAMICLSLIHLSDLSCVVC
jgi:alpha-acetolactate decarboxylase